MPTSKDSQELLISIIIPAHNCRPWLARSVQSACKLHPTNVEVILVDDGSTDGSASCIEELESCHHNLKVIRQPFRGVSAARNAGLLKSTGSYVVFLDADDELLPFEIDIARRFNVDVLKIGSEEIGVDGSKILRQETHPLSSGIAYLDQKIASSSVYVPCWSYIYRRTFLLNNGIHFKEGIIHEDMLFTVQALLSASTFAATNKLLYRYIRRTGSITMQGNYFSSKQRMTSLACIVREVLALSNRHKEIDLWRWAAHVTDYAWSFALEARSRRLACKAFQLELSLLINYQGRKQFRERRHEMWRLRRGFRRLLRPEWAD